MSGEWNESLPKVIHIQASGLIDCYLKIKCLHMKKTFLCSNFHSKCWCAGVLTFHLARDFNPGWEPLMSPNFPVFPASEVYRKSIDPTAPCEDSVGWDLTGIKSLRNKLVKTVNSDLKLQQTLPYYKSSYLEALGLYTKLWSSIHTWSRECRCQKSVCPVPLSCFMYFPSLVAFNSRSLWL